MNGISSYYGPSTNTAVAVVVMKNYDLHQCSFYVVFMFSHSSYVLRCNYDYKALIFCSPPYTTDDLYLGKYKGKAVSTCSFL